VPFQSDLDKVIKNWNEWTNKNNPEPYSAWVLSADYNSTNYAFDIGWLGVWDDGNAMGRGSDIWFDKGAKQAAAFAEILTCAAHNNYASEQIKKGTAEDGSSAVIRFSDCKVKQGKSMKDAVNGLKAWASYWEEQGSKSSQWVFYPVFGEDVDYDLKRVEAHSIYAELGADYERYGNGGGFMRSQELLDGLLDCGVSRVYQSTKVRDGLPK